jgi:acyl-CoA synthetase (AMP-forming)/AMP-acid ligase II
LASFKRSRTFVITEVPKTLAGKVQKFKIRQMMRQEAG